MEIQRWRRMMLLIAVLSGLVATPLLAQQPASTTSSNAVPVAAETMNPDRNPLSTLANPSEAVPAVAPVAPIQPFLTDSAKISTGDTAWMLSATALVLLMTIPGLAMFYAGMVRKKNLLTTMAHSFVTVCIVTILWVTVGYSLSFTPGSLYLGSLDRFMLDGMMYLKDAGKVSVSHIAPTIPESVFMMFQMTFAIITPALITGAFAERMKFSALMWFIALWSLLVYVPVAHWVWEPAGWLAARGVLDFAGGTVVHINAGISGLVAALIIGPRAQFRRIAMPPHNLSYTVIGASLLWVGWFGFNAGSALAADGRAGHAMMVTQVASATGALAWLFIEWIRRGKPSVLGIISGAVGGLVAITPASGFVGVGGALAIGAVAGIACFFAATSLKNAFGYDDSLDVFGIHAVGGIVGALLTGVFALKSIGGVEGHLSTQTFGVVVTVVYSAVMTGIILLVIKLLIGLRVSEADEETGLDEMEHGEHVA